MTLQEVFEGLCRPFPTEEVKWRVGPTTQPNPDEPPRGQALAYIDARAVMDRLDAVVGWDRWQCSYTHGVDGIPSVVCNIGVFVGGQWIWKADGAGPTDAEPEKGALSDAFKRAAVRWGIGRYLHDLRAPWVELVVKGKSKVIPKETMARLDKLHDDFAQTLIKQHQAEKPGG